VNEPCKHVVCHKLGDATCHINADGWIVNATAEVNENLKVIFGWLEDELARACREGTNNGRELVRVARELLASPNLSAKDRKGAEKMIERLRLSGVPGNE
jgi:hypothetical protein